MNLLRILACALTVGVISPMAQAQTQADLYPVSFPISVDGRDATLYLALHLPLSPVTTETMPDGTKHNRFTSVMDEPYDWFTAWRIAYGPPDLFRYGLFRPFSVDTYLTPTGASRLAFFWEYQLDCHGGCYRLADLRFDLASPTGELFGDTLQDDVFALSKDVYGAGYQLIVTEQNRDGTKDFEVTGFSVGTVPEPESLALALAGLMAVGLSSRVRRPHARGLTVACRKGD